ncbi:MAG: MraY family glycosyltransferase [Cyanobium sp.]
MPALIDRLAGGIPFLPQPAAMASPHGVVGSFALAAALSWLLLWALMPLLRRGLLDQPNRRSSHRVATPRGGGLSFVVVASGLSLALGQGKAAWIPVICLPLALVGLLDDRLDLPAASRYLAQVLTAVALLALAATPLPTWSLPVVLIAITAVINFVNFMDGLDGLVGLSVLVLMAACGQWLLAGALAGFLLWNWSPARVFMGDVGSTWLGAVLAGLVLQQPTPLAALSLLLVGVPLLGDALTCVLRRLAAGQPVFQAHRLHLFQRLQRAGWSHRRVALTYGTATGLLALCRQSGSALLLLGATGCVLLLAWRLEQRVAVPFARAAQDN